MAGVFQKWVADSGGMEKVAKRLGVSFHTVKYWHSRKGNPKVEAIIKLIALGRGRLTFENIIASTLPTSRKK